MQASASGEDEYVCREIGAANAGRVKFAAGGASWIVAADGGGTVLGAEGTPSLAAGAKHPALQSRPK
jgi:hypothetical protein